MASFSHSQRFRLAALLGLVSGAFAPLGAGQLLGDGKSLLVRDGARYTLVSGGSTVEIQPPANTEIEAVVSLDRKALVSGTTRTEDDSASTELYLAIADGAAVAALPAPPGRKAGESREQAVGELAAGGGLAGVAWLEGASAKAFRVMSARWEGASWSDPEEVAPAGPGSQQALAGARLADGRSILVWSRFDGADDEIVWSVRESGRWSAPAAVAADNRVPDIVPAIVAVPGGALAAWSRYDGHDYRLVVSKFDGRAWSAPSEVGGAGSVYPALSPAAGGARLLFESARPHGWIVVELDTAGRAHRSAAVERDSPERPVLVGEELRWAGESRRLRWN